MSAIQDENFQKRIQPLLLKYQRRFSLSCLITSLLAALVPLLHFLSPDLIQEGASMHVFRIFHSMLLTLSVLWFVNNLKHFRSLRKIKNTTYGDEGPRPSIEEYLDNLEKKISALPPKL